MFSKLEPCPRCRGKKEIVISWEEWRRGHGTWIERIPGVTGHTISFMSADECCMICTLCCGKGKVSREKYIEEVLSQ
jgi:hypothetical protein